jgi:hypothetical protein
MEGVDALHLAPQGYRLLLEPLSLQGAGHHQVGVVRVEGLLQVVVGPQLHRLDRVPHRGVGGHHDHLGLRSAGLDGAQHFETIHPRHPEVGHHHVEGLGGDQGDGPASIGGGGELVPVAEDAGEELEDVLLVVDDEDASTFHG